MKINKRLLVTLGIAGILLLTAGTGIYFHNKNVKQQIVIEEREKEKEEKEKAEKREEAKRAEESRRQELKSQAEVIDQKLQDVNTDESVCKDAAGTAETAQTVLKEIQNYRDSIGQEESLASEALELLKETEKQANILIQIRSIDETLLTLYDPVSDQTAICTRKNEKAFQEIQQEIWSVPDKYEKKKDTYNHAVSRISEEWNFINDDWNYESSTLKVSVEEMHTDYAKYWKCHILTFSPQQICSSLCGGTYGNPRVKTSEETTDHNGIIGINGSEFSYGSGIPAEGKSMIKSGEIYNDIYSNGNIMCVTQDGGMFTAPLAMTTEEMISRGVKDTYCFGPTLVENGEAYEISGAFNQTYRYQRTAVGMVSPGEYYIIIVEKAGESQGMTYTELQQIFLELGCDYAYNLDGGGSTTLIFKGRIINSLTDGAERPCGDILYFIDAGDGGEGEEIIIHEDEGMLKPSSGSGW